MKVRRASAIPGGVGAQTAGFKGIAAKVGFFESAKYPDGTPVAYVASIQEFGSGKIPPRSFMRTTIAEQGPEWTKQFGRAAVAIIKGKIEPAAALDQIGALAAADVKKKITQITSPPLQEATIAARRNRRADKKTTGKLTKPLVDTGIMLASVTHVVEAPE